MSDVRYHYMDNLRAAAMLGGVLFHAALAYLPVMQQIWLSASPESSELMSVLAWFTHLFRMPLFFLIAGFFAAYLVRKRGAGGLLRNRAVRILLPFVIFLPLVYATMIAPIFWALEHVENTSPMLQFVAELVKQPDAQGPPPSTTHLWFTYNLFMFCLAYAVLSRIATPLAGLADRWISTRTIVLLLPLLLVPALSTQVEPHPAPEQFVPRAWSFGYYGVFFLLGSLYFRRQQLLDELRPCVLPMVGASLLMYAVYYAALPRDLSVDDAMAMVAGPAFSLRQLAISVLEAYLSVFLTLTCLDLGRRYLDRASSVVRYVADSSYWIYIMHLPTLLFIQYLLLDVSWNPWLEFTITTLSTFAIGIVSYAILVRHTPIGWMLNGRRRRSAAAPRSGHGDAARVSPERLYTPGAGNDTGQELRTGRH